MGEKRFSHTIFLFCSDNSMAFYNSMACRAVFQNMDLVVYLSAFLMNTDKAGLAKTCRNTYVAILPSLHFCIKESSKNDAISVLTNVFPNPSIYHKVTVHIDSALSDMCLLNNLYSLHMTNCENLVDVSGLGGVHTLNLVNCHLITDVSALGKATLSLQWCSILVDVSALGNVHTLDLTACDGITNISALGNVHTLYLTECKGITDISALGNVHTLDLTGCDGITDISALGNVHTLYLTRRRYFYA
jgi:hypothetical protein